jgi:hypothetical protein
MLQLSRAAIVSAFADGSEIISSSQRRPRAIDATSEVDTKYTNVKLKDLRRPPRRGFLLRAKHRSQPFQSRWFADRTLNRSPKFPKILA